jgi:tRNA 2-thiouridine synthesizing protein A
MSYDVDLRLNVSDTCCPLPLIQLAKSIPRLTAGQTLEVTGNDPIFESSVRDFCRANGHAVLQATTGDDDSVVLLIRVGG